MAVTILDIAKAANVSHSTVSRALNNSKLISDETRRRIIEIADSLHYVPNAAARNLVANQSGNILFLVSEGVSAYPASFTYEIMDGVHSELPHFQTLVHRKVKSAQMIENIVSSNHYDGVLFIYVRDSDMDVIHQLSKLKVPFVVINRNLSELGIYCVYANEYNGVQEGIEYLISLGHTRIAHIMGPKDVASTYLRYSAFVNTLHKHNLTVYTEYILPGDFQPARGFQAMQELLDLPVPPTALFAANDLTAVGALKACAARHCSVPEQISVLGFDDMEFSQYLIPSLTTIGKSKKDMGILAIRLLRRILADKNETDQKSMSYDLSLKYRQSCEHIMRP